MNTRTIKSHWKTVAALGVALLLYVLFHTLSPFWDHVLLTVVVVILVHLLDRLVLMREWLEDIDVSSRRTTDSVNSETHRAVDTFTTTIVADIDKRIAALIRSVASLNAMEVRGVVNVYQARKQGISDLRDDLLALNNSRIRIIGITLNDFLLATGDRTLTTTWSKLATAVRSDTTFDPRQTKLKVQILIIDPHSRGAYLRAHAEERGSKDIKSSLAGDVRQAEHILRDLERAAEQNIHVSFEGRFYQSPPITFLCLTDQVAHFQPYLFWSARRPDTPIPMMRVRSGSESPDEVTFYDDLDAHFEWIWTSASRPISELTDQHRIGIEEGVGMCGMTDVYVRDEDVRRRVTYLLDNAKRRVWIQGISLRSVFAVDHRWYIALTRRLSDPRQPPVDLRILLLDSDCEQANYRSFLETASETKAPGDRRTQFEDYKSGRSRSSEEPGIRARLDSALQHDVKASIRALTKLSDVSVNGLSGALRSYESAPACFMCLVDDTVLVEQYHYGKIAFKPGAALLGKDMPLCEFSKTTDRLFPSVEGRNAFSLLESHFERAWELSVPVNLGNLGQATPGRADVAQTLGGD